MDRRGRKRWFRSLLLAAPLVLLAAWIVHGGIRATHGPMVSESPAGTGPDPAGERPWERAAMPEPDEDLPAARLEQRVNGAADYLRGHGCLRIVAWRIPDPPADVELLVFADAEGASAVLARDAGPGRDPGPGDEASIAGESVFFRRGNYYVRLLAGPGDAGESLSSLLDVAGRLDRSLASGPAGGGP